MSTLSAIHGHAAAPPPSAEAIEHWLASAIEARLGLAPGTVSAGERFAQYGVSSAVSLQIAADLGAWLGRRCSPALFWDHPTPRALATYLAGAEHPVE